LNIRKSLLERVREEPSESQFPSKGGWIMYSKIKILGHPVHPMLVAFPIAFYTSTLIAFVIYAFSGAPFWFRVGITANVAGGVMAAVAATFGFLDWYLGIPGGTDAKSTGIKHMILNVISLLLFLVTLLFNAGEWNATAPVMRGAIILPLIGFLTTLGAGYYGWTLVQNHHVGVEFTSAEESCIREFEGFHKRVV
jgi:uncharacterized membrane protein